MLLIIKWVSFCFLDIQTQHQAIGKRGSCGNSVLNLISRRFSYLLYKYLAIKIFLFWTEHIESISLYLVVLVTVPNYLALD